MRSINRYCPHSGKPVAADSLTQYRGFTVGFCNPGCRDDFAAAPEKLPRDVGYFDALIKEHGLTVMVISSPLETVQIREYRPGSEADATAFRQLNEEWIERYFVIEDDDRRVLGDPEGQILESGGAILFAQIDEKIVGCSALIVQPDEPRTYELAKLAVTAPCQGRQLGRRLMEASMAKAQTLGAKRLVLTTNSKLLSARRLYESLNFTYVPTAQAETFRGHYERGDTFMELSLPQ